MLLAGIVTRIKLNKPYAAESMLNPFYCGWVNCASTEVPKNRYPQAWSLFSYDH